MTGQRYLATDPLGRDIAARLFMAGRISLLVDFVAMVLATLVDTLIGVIAGYRGGWISAFLMRTVDGFLSFPSICLPLSLSAVLKPSAMTITVNIAVAGWMEVARIGRGLNRDKAAELKRPCQLRGGTLFRLVLRRSASALAS